MENIKALSKRYIEFFEEGKKMGKYKTAVEFCNIIDVKPQALNEVVKGRSNVGLQLIQNTLLKFPELNPHWIFTGKGNMLLGELPGQKNQITISTVPQVVVTNDNGAEQIVMMDSKAAAGFPAHINDRDFYSRLPTLKLPKLSDKQGTFICVQITGDSMEPTIQHDQWVVAKFIEDVETNIRGGDICLVVTNDGVICKRVYPDKKSGAIECVSDNDDYRAFELMPSEYLQVYKYACDINFNPSNKNSDLRKEVKQLNKRITTIEKTLKL